MLTHKLLLLWEHVLAVHHLLLLLLLLLRGFSHLLFLLHELLRRWLPAIDSLHKSRDGIFVLASSLGALNDGVVS